MCTNNGLLTLIKIRITSASPREILEKINKAGVIIYHLQMNDDLTLVFDMRKSDFKKVAYIADRMSAQMIILKKSGILWSLMQLKKRPVLVVGAIILLFLTFYIPSKVFFVSVVGNNSVETKLILEKAELYGITFGADRRDIRSEKIKNYLLGDIPELGWVGVNTYGCVAVISVQERTQPDITEKINGVASIVASHDGIIVDCVVRRGNRLCKVGESVNAGQVLVSGYTDCGISTKAEVADGEIYARTQRTVDMFLMTEYRKRKEIMDSATDFDIIFGKNLIKLSQYSGIPDASCGKIYKIDYLTLPGGFQLPIALITTTTVTYAYEDDFVEPDGVEWAEALSMAYLKHTMISGDILDVSSVYSNGKGFVRYTASADCVEMIGRLKTEEIYIHNGKNN